MSQFGPHFLTHKDYGSFSGKSVTVRAELNHFGPHFLPHKRKAFVAQVGDVAVTISGGAAFAQGEELEGYSYSITIDSVQLLAGAGAVTVDEGRDSLQELTTATASPGSNYEIDDRTGFRSYPHWHPLSNLVEDGYGRITRKKSADPKHPQDYIKSRGNDPSEGPQHAESENVFISTSISPEDL